MFYYGFRLCACLGFHAVAKVKKYQNMFGISSLGSKWKILFHAALNFSPDTGNPANMELQTSFLTVRLGILFKSTRFQGHSQKGWDNLFRCSILGAKTF